MEEKVTIETQSRAALGRLKPAFRACPEAYSELCKAVKAGRVSVYRLQSDAHDLTVAGERDGDDYFLWGVAGRGLASGLVQLKQLVKTAGMSSLSADTAFAGVARLVRGLGVTATHERDMRALKWEVC
ncbi:DNAase [Vibrio sp. SM6]|uniref:DNAase n=1 Tax=Vibrio agarilyticus TaxID=2726741 RepID=A0A7X8TQY5_9VIBR|nr:DNAase [Vibrio agarilyticus]NLS13362.1 DNAase [Vibrio agarilyticus]